jgi:hypothetical protein
VCQKKKGADWDWKRQTIIREAMTREKMAVLECPKLLEPDHHGDTYLGLWQGWSEAGLNVQLMRQRPGRPGLHPFAGPSRFAGWLPQMAV